jgi:hypothetical protein
MSAPRMTRRALLAGIAASSTVALPAIASALPEPAGEVQGLLDEFLAVRRQSLVADDAYELHEIAVRETYPKRPASLTGKQVRHDGTVNCYRLTAYDINRHHDDPNMVLNLSGEEIAKLEKKRVALLRRLAKWEAREEAILDASGYPELKAKADALDTEQDRLIDAIVTSPARTMGDVAAKVRFLGEWEPFTEIELRPEDMGVVERAYLSLFSDVLNLAEKGGAA